MNIFIYIMFICFIYITDIIIKLSGLMDGIVWIKFTYSVKKLLY